MRTPESYEAAANVRKEVYDLRKLLERAADTLQDYAAMVQDDMNDPLAMEIRKRLEEGL